MLLKSAVFVVESKQDREYLGDLCMLLFSSPNPGSEGFFKETDMLGPVWQNMWVLAN